ncbi:PREDICTED: probable pectinesterase 66 [Tarenaya hassleriana]|uniref:probable pectinesterase 66 n=1 Tax=Tarenaya hassleriana TaxID=28532 RepID=UPI00053C9B37|nr:PREDICTED: probable pectinesterase 66 [Tarenaya hassleriana]
MMSFGQGLLHVILVLTLYVHACTSMDCQLNPLDSNGVALTIAVGHEGKFSNIQQAIDSIPSGNDKWIRIYITYGSYKEKIKIPKDKGCLYMEGESQGNTQTTISWGDHDSTDQSSTFTAVPDNIVLKNLRVENTYGLYSKEPLKQAVAVRLLGDKYAIVNCSFIGLQDTLWDGSGRHYFKGSYISGVVDFIWGSGQSIYEDCTLNVDLKSSYPPRTEGVIVAQGRESESEGDGFVFKWCKITGGPTMLGRGYRPYSRVIFYQCHFPNTILPQGWDAWTGQGNEHKLTFVEADNNGPGADLSKRVPWLKKMSAEELSKFTDLSYINSDGWMAKLPPNYLKW